MKRSSVYPYNIIEPPGVNLHRLRSERGWSMRMLAEKCRPPLDHTTVRRLEYNQGYTQDSLERVAKALDVTVPELFWPKESRANERLRRLRGKVKFSVSIDELRQD